VAGGEQPSDEVGSHPSESDHAQLHACSSLERVSFRGR